MLGGGFEVVTQDDPIAALSLLDSAGDFAVVIADVNMPRMDGLTFLRRAKSVSPTTTRVALTGRLGIDPASLPPNAVFRVINKPCPPDLLQRHVADAVAYHDLLAGSPVQPVEPSAAPRRTEAREPLGTSQQAPPVEADDLDDLPASAVLLPPNGVPAGLRDKLRPGVGVAELASDLARWVRIDQLSETPPPAFVLPCQRIGVRVEGRTVELLPGKTVVGRSRTCHIPLDDAGVSRRHLCFLNTGTSLSVENVSSTNGFWVNDTFLECEAAMRLVIGDHIKLGPYVIEVCALGDYCPSFEPTARLVAAPAPPVATPEGTATLATLAQVADKYFRLGQLREAERIVRPALDGLLRHCEVHEVASELDVVLATEWALRLGEASRAPEWIEYMFELYASIGRVPTADVVDRLYRLVPDLRGARIGSFRRFVDTLGTRQDELGPSERFLFRRIVTLERTLKANARQ